VETQVSSRSFSSWSSSDMAFSVSSSRVGFFFLSLFLFVVLESSFVDSVTIVTDFFGSFSAPMVVVCVYWTYWDYWFGSEDGLIG